MIRTILKRIYATLFLLLLLTAHVGQKVHIATEDLQTFAAFSGDLVPDNGADSEVSQYCVVCHYEFFKYLEESQTPHVFYSELLAVLQPEATRCKCYQIAHLVYLRAPPVA